MLQRLKLLACFALFWITFFLVARVIFLIYNYEYTHDLVFNEITKVFLYGLKMDVSMASYFLMLTGLIVTVSVFILNRWIFYILNIITNLLMVVSALIVTVDLELYRHWGFRLNTTPLFYIKSAESEAFGSVAFGVVIKLALILFALLAVFLVGYYKFLAPRISMLKPTEKKSATALLVATACLVLTARGSFTVAPMNTGFVFFHQTKAFANHAAINVVWNFLYSLQGDSNIQYPEDFFPRENAGQYFSSLYPPSDSTYHLFRTARPNVILFIVESFTADIITPLGGMAGIAPKLDQLCTEGILFDNCYASGDRTDKGIISVLSGYPAQPVTSIIKYPAKTQRLPYLNRDMRSLGYNTSFVYGGDIDFANFRSYLTNCQFDHITSDVDFPDDLNVSKWGVHDHIVLDRAFAECDTAKKPFFKVILTLSSHEPFDVPMQPFIRGNDEESLFLNACHYTDKSIGTFIERAKQKSWWQNTLVIFVADHGHRLPGNKALQDKERFRIPLLMIGGAIKKDTIIHTVVNQTDIANTLLAQLDKPNPSYIFSKNIFAPNATSFSAYFFNDGYGFITPNQYIIYDNTGKQFLRNIGASQKDLDVSKAYQQTLFSDYNKR